MPKKKKKAPPPYEYTITLKKYFLQHRVVSPPHLTPPTPHTQSGRNVYLTMSFCDFGNKYVLCFCLSVLSKPKPILKLLFFSLKPKKEMVFSKEPNLVCLKSSRLFFIPLS